MISKDLSKWNVEVISCAGGDEGQLELRMLEECHEASTGARNLQSDRGVKAFRFYSLFNEKPSTVVRMQDLL